jgi:hypothetical protein
VERPREYTNSNNKKISVVKGFVADNTGHTKMSVYNKLAFSFMKKGNCILLINVIIKPDEIVATGYIRKMRRGDRLPLTQTTYHSLCIVTVCDSTIVFPHPFAKFWYNVM